MKYWGPWLDTTHPHPAKPGELRWFTTINGEDREVDGPGPHLIDGEQVYACRGQALDPDQPDGSSIALPPDPELRADLCAPTWKLGARGILVESKDGSSGFGNLRQRLGRSPGKGDAVVMAWSEGNEAATTRHNQAKWASRPPPHRWIV